MFDACYNTRKPRPAHHRKKKKKKIILQYIKEPGFSSCLHVIFFSSPVTIFSFEKPTSKDFRSRHQYIKAFDDHPQMNND